MNVLEKPVNGSNNQVALLALASNILQRPLPQGASASLIEGWVRDGNRLQLQMTSDWQDRNSPVLPAQQPVVIPPLTIEVNGPTEDFQAPTEEQIAESFRAIGADPITGQLIVDDQTAGTGRDRTESTQDSSEEKNGSNQPG